MTAASNMLQTELTNSEKILNAALEYRDRGFSVIPINRKTKKPLIKWKKYQSQLPTEDKIYAWWEKWPDANIGIVTGRISGFWVLDIDGPKGVAWADKNVPITSVYSKTREARYQAAFSIPAGVTIKNTVRQIPEIDSRGEGGYIVAPPSIHHKTGKPYELHFTEGLDGWNDLTKLDFNDVLAKYKKTAANGDVSAVGSGNLNLDLSGVKIAPINEPVKKGQRNDTLARLAGKWIQAGLDDGEIETLAIKWNTGNEPPLKTPEIKKTIRSIRGIDDSKKHSPEGGEGANKFEEALITGPDLDEKFENILALPWRIKGILPEAAKLNELYGLPGTYKSFIALDMALCVSADIEWHGRPVLRCPVVYAAAEGQAGVLKRVKAWQVYHDIDSLENFSLLPLPCLLDEPAELQEFITALKTLPEPPGIIFIDTLARSMAGDENSTADMGKIVNACGRITQQTGAQILLIHHTGKDASRGPRGAIALTGATDCLFEVCKKTDRVATLICERQKDDEPFAPMGFQLETQTTGRFNDDGDELVSLVPVFDPEVIQQKKDKNSKIKGANRIAFNALTRAIGEHGQEPAEDVKKKMTLFSQAERVVHEDHWRTMAYGMGISEGEQGAKQKAFSRARKTLMDLEMVDCWDDFYWITAICG